MDFGTATRTLSVTLAISLSAATASAAGPLRYYPKRAQRMNVEGKAVIACSVTADGMVPQDASSFPISDP